MKSFEEYLTERELTGKLVTKDGEWFYKKPNSDVRMGPYKSATEAANAARKAGVKID